MATIKGLVKYLKNSRFIATIRTAKLNVLKRRYASGDKIALIDALKMYTDVDRTVMPDWVAGAVFQALNEWRDCEVLTLDEAFGVTRPKNFSLDKARKERVTAFHIYAEYDQAHQEAKNLRGETAFTVLTKKFPTMAAGTIKKYYYIAKNEIDPKIDIQ